MVRIRYFDGAKHVEIEVTEEFAAEYAAMEHRDKLIERKETRRHQSLDKSLEHGWDIPDPSVDVALQAERNEEKALLSSALKKLTDKQRAVLLLYIEEGLSFREIGEKLGIHKDTAKEHYHADKKFAKNFTVTPPQNAFPVAIR